LDRGTQVDGVGDQAKLFEGPYGDVFSVLSGSTYIEISEAGLPNRPPPTSLMNLGVAAVHRLPL
jgi:hypothetical protein